MRGFLRKSIGRNGGTDEYGITLLWNSPFIRRIYLMNLLIVVNNWAAGSPLPVWSYPLFLCLTWFIQAVMIPVCLKLGQNMVVVVFMLMVFLPIAILFGLNRLGIWTDAGIQSAFDFLQQNTMVLVTVGSIVAVALYILSFFLTLYFYKKMDF